MVDISPWTLAGASSSDKKLVASQLGEAFEGTGFAVIVGHGVPAGEVEAMRECSIAFFEGAEHVKRAIKADAVHGAQGYHMQGHENVAQLLGDFSRKPDMVERMVFRNLHNHQSRGGCSAGGHGAPKFPDERHVPGFRAAVDEFFSSVCRLHDTLMAVAECALELPVGFFEAYYGSEMGTSINIANYLRQRCSANGMDQVGASGPDDEDDIAFGAHTDSGGLTILSIDAPGLEVFLAEGWTPVPVLEGAFVVNVGRLLSRWANDRWLASVHRVRKPIDRRLTLATFFTPRSDATIECLPTCAQPEELYKPIAVGEFMYQRHLLHIPPEQRKLEEQNIDAEFWEAADPAKRQRQKPSPLTGA